MAAISREERARARQQLRTVYEFAPPAERTEGRLEEAALRALLSPAEWAAVERYLALASAVRSEIAALKRNNRDQWNRDIALR